MFNSDAVNKILAGYQQPAYTSEPLRPAYVLYSENKRLRAALEGYDQIVRVVISALKRDAEDGKAIRGEMAKRLEDALNVACEATEGK